MEQTSTSGVVVYPLVSHPGHDHGWVMIGVRVKNACDSKCEQANSKLIQEGY